MIRITHPLQQPPPLTTASPSSLPPLLFAPTAIAVLPGTVKTVYDIQPAAIATSAMHTRTAQGNLLYYCQDWNFEDKQCEGTWQLFQSILLDKEYSFAIPAQGGGFGEIIAIGAVHLDEAYNIISDIYPSIKNRDENWSEPIYQNEIVRVTYEYPLQNGNMIDVYARSQATYAYFDIFEAGTNNKVGRSGVIDKPEVQYIRVAGLQQPTDTFDFNVVKFTREDQEEDNSSDIDSTLKSFLEFDYIHDDQINTSHADGVLVYGESAVNIPRYRLWNDSKAFTAELNSNNVGGVPRWITVRANHERDQVIMASEDGSNDLNIQFLNATDSWANLTELTADIPNVAHRAFDLRVEDVSGDTLIVYENSSLGTNNQVAYRIWNGVNFSTETLLSTELANDAVEWVQLTSRPKTDAIMLLAHTGIGDLYAVEWNGTAFDSKKNTSLSLATASSTFEHFAFAWETDSTNGFVMYGEGNNLVYRIYDSNDPLGNYWSAEQTIALGNSLNSVRLCSDPKSDYIGIIVQDGGNDVNVRMWNGTTILASPPTEDGATEPNGANNANVACAWNNLGNYALFGFIDNAALAFDYFNFTKTNTWSTADLTVTSTTSNVASDDIAGLRFVGHPTTNETMAVALDILEDGSIIRWDGKDFQTVAASPFEASTVVLNGDQEGAMFDWDRFDPIPNVTNVTPVNINFLTSAVVNITANVTDNIRVSNVTINITLPNLSIRIRNLSDHNGDNIYNMSFVETQARGQYMVRVIANDTSTHKNINKSVTFNFSVGDSTAPNVTIFLPVNGSAFNQNSSIEFKVNATDSRNISKVFANITLPNADIRQLNLTNSTSADNYTGNFTETGAPGNYFVRIYANDTSNNLNNTQTTQFNVGDTTNPRVLNIVPVAGTNTARNATINISANVTDNINVSQVHANVTLPNATIRQINITNKTKDTYNMTFNETVATGIYNITFLVNDTTNNANRTEKTYFSVGDIVNATITLHTPVNNTNTTNTSLNFNFTAIDNLASALNCSLRLDNTINQTNSSTLNNTVTRFTIVNMSLGSHLWNVSCSDGTNRNVSQTRNFTIDFQYPNFFNLNTTPSTEDDLDPSRMINVTANVSDNHTGVGVVVLQYRLSGGTEFTNLTMQYNATTKLYNVSFNATNNGTYNLRVFANDSLGNYNHSAIINRSVQYDRTWTRTPAILTGVTGSLNINTSIGNFTVNNTGDFKLNFTINSSSRNTTFNQTNNFELAAQAVKFIMANDSINTTGVKTITLTINATPGATPTSQTMIGTIVNAPGQPFLQTLFDTPTGTVTKQQGDSVTFTATLRNIGEGNATNVTHNITVPDNWTITSGTTNQTIATFDSRESNEKTLTVTIPTNYATGLVTIVTNTSGLNQTGSNIGLFNLTQGNTVIVNVSAKTTLGAPTPDSGGAGGGGGGGGGVGGAGSASKVVKVAVGPGETIHTEETIRVLRGSEEGAIISVTNMYQNTFFENLEVNIEGFMSQYVKLTPLQKTAQEVYVNTINYDLWTERKPSSLDTASIFGHTIQVESITQDQATATLIINSEPLRFVLKKGQTITVDLDKDKKNDLAIALKDVFAERIGIEVHKLGVSDPKKIQFGETRQYKVEILAPSYLQKAKYDLTIKIAANMVALFPETAGFTMKPLTELRRVTLFVHEVNEKQANISLEQTFVDIRSMETAGFPTLRMYNLLGQMKQALNESRYEQAQQMGEQINRLKRDAFETDQLMKEVAEGIAKTQTQWLSVPETENALALAKKAFEREDFSTALQRAKDAQLSLVLETQGRINILWFVLRYWWALLLGAFAVALVGFGVYKHLSPLIIAERINNLDKEEETINTLLEEAQIACFKEQRLSTGEYEKITEQYHKRLQKIKQIRVSLRNRRVSILRTEQEITKLHYEETDLTAMMKEAQEEYLVKQKLSRRRFTDIYGTDKERLTEVQEEYAVLQEKLDKEELTKEYQLLLLFNKVYNTIEEIVIKSWRYLPLPSVSDTSKKKVQKVVDTMVDTTKIMLQKIKGAVHKTKSTKLYPKAYPQKKDDRTKFTKTITKDIAIKRERMKIQEEIEKERRERKRKTPEEKIRQQVKQQDEKERNTKNVQKGKNEDKEMRRSTKRMSKEELKKWFPGAFK